MSFLYDCNITTNKYEVLGGVGISYRVWIGDYHLFECSKWYYLFECNNTK